MSNFIKNIDCPSCGSHMRAAVYKDGGIYCHKCSYTQKGTEMNEDMMDETAEFAQDYVEEDVLKKRKINSDTARFFGVTEHAGSVTFPYGSKTKVRSPGKSFRVVGGKLSSLFGQDKFSSGGKAVCITEGEFDAISAYQMLSGQVPCVSVPNGAAAALKDCQEAFEWLDSFDTVVVCFDSDKPGQEAAAQVAELFGSKAKLVRFESGYKDANDYLVASSQAKFVKAFWAAEAYRPDGVVTFGDVIDRRKNAPKKEAGVPWCFPTLTRITHGRRKGEIYTFGAGVGVGKTDFFTQQMAFDISELQMPVGVIYLEQPVDETIERIAGKMVKKMLHIPGCVDPEELETHLEKCRDKGMFFDHWGAKDWETIEAKVRYMNKAHGIQSFYFDHLTALITETDNPRRELDRILARIASMAQNLGLYWHQISHLNKPEGPAGHEDGARVLTKHFAESQAIARWSHYMVGIERNTTSEDPKVRSVATVRNVKARFDGRSNGEFFHVLYDNDTGIMNECETPEEKDEVL